MLRQILFFGIFPFERVVNGDYPLPLLLYKEKGTEQYLMGYRCLIYQNISKFKIMEILMG